MSDNPFTEDYFMNGPEKGLSNYSQYTWKPSLTMPMADMLIRYLGMKEGDSILDYGCARGYLVHALRTRGMDASGVDISDWAVENCHPMSKSKIFKLSNTDWCKRNDFVFSKDCFEHIQMETLEGIVECLATLARKSMLFIVPLTDMFGGEYVNPNDEKDSTHIHRMTLEEWVELIFKLAPDFVVSGSYHIPVLKKASEDYPRSCGFITAVRF